MSKIADFFKFREHNISCKKEFIAGITAFITVVYILVVRPEAIVDYGNAAFTIDANSVIITKKAVIVTCTIISGLIAPLITLYADLPSTLAASMGSNFVFGALIQSQQLSLGGTMVMTLISGVIFLLLTIFSICDLIIKAIPKNIRISIDTTIGFFITYLGFKNTRIAAFMESGIGMGNLTNPAVVLATLGLVTIAILTTYKVNGAILTGIAIITLLGVPARVATMPSTFARVPDSTELGNIVSNLDFKSVFSFSPVILVFTAFCGGFFSTPGTILGVSAKADMLDENGDLPNIQQPFLVDAIDTCASALTGNTVITTFVESSAGAEAGGRTGFTSVVVSAIFMVTVSLSPLVLMIPNAATGPALTFVDFLMISSFKDIGFTDLAESLGPFAMIMFTVFTGSIASGISTGILAFILVKTTASRLREVHPIMYIIAIPLICCFIYG